MNKPAITLQKAISKDGMNYAFKDDDRVIMGDNTFIFESFGLDIDEERGFTAKKSVEKLIKATITQYHERVYTFSVKQMLDTLIYLNKTGNECGIQFSVNIISFKNYVRHGTRNDVVTNIEYKNTEYNHNRDFKEKSTIYLSIKKLLPILRTFKQLDHDTMQIEFDNKYQIVLKQDMSFCILQGLRPEAFE